MGEPWIRITCFKETIRKEVIGEAAAIDIREIRRATDLWLIVIDEPGRLIALGLRGAPSYAYIKKGEPSGS